MHESSHYAWTLKSCMNTQIMHEHSNHAWTLKSCMNLTSCMNIHIMHDHSHQAQTSNHAWISHHVWTLKSCLNLTSCMNHQIMYELSHHVWNLTSCMKKGCVYCQWPGDDIFELIKMLSWVATLQKVSLSPLFTISIVFSGQLPYLYTWL